MKYTQKLIYLLLVVSFTFVSIVYPAQAQGPTNFPNCRLGVGGAFAPTDVNTYNLAQLNIGNYLDWSTHANPNTEVGLPTNINYLQMIRVHQNKVGGWNSAYSTPYTYTVTPNTSQIQTIATAITGSMWLIGNEIERRDWDGGNQDEILPELYAQAFHEIQGYIKDVDPTAKIAIGSVIEGTTLRLAYLDRVWDSHFNQYGYTMGNDVDFWNVHGFLLREVRNSWGAEVPAGFDNNDSDPTNNYNPSDGFLFGADIPTIVAEHHDIQNFIDFTVALRQWMADHGEQNKPLINTEYGILYKNISGSQITSQQVNDYMNASFDYMFNTTNTNIGYPADEYRLVQQWVWYSMNDNAWNGNLFNPSNKALTTFGTNWKSYVENPAKPKASTPQRNLLVTNLRTDPESHNGPGNKTFKLMVDVANSGNIAVTTTITVTFWNGDPDAGGTQIGTAQTLTSLPGCGQFVTFEQNWTVSNPVNTWYAKVQTGVTETTTGDNKASHTAYIFNPAPTADIALTKTVDDNAPVEGFGTIKYTIILNSSGLANDVVISDTLPGGLVFKSYQASQGTYFSSGPWQVGDVMTNNTAVLTITAGVNTGTANNTITNTARVSSTASIDTNPTNNEATVAITPKPADNVFVPIILKE